MRVSEASRHKLSVAERHVMNGCLKEVRSEDTMRNEVDSLKDKWVEVEVRYYQQETGDDFCKETKIIDKRRLLSSGAVKKL